MLPTLGSVFGCCAGRNRRTNAIECTSAKVLPMNDDEAAAAILNALFNAEKNGHDLRRAVDGIVRETGWTGGIAAAVLNGLEAAIRNGTPMGQAMKEAFDKAVGAAVDFAREHPVYCAILALGILVCLAPWAVEALGFSELGPIEGSFAAKWQATYVGFVPKGSLFSYLQRMGMCWGRSLG